MAEELLRSITDLYGGGLARVVEIARDRDPEMFDELVRDPVLSSLLLVHGLHPDALDARVERALESVRPFLARHGGDVELLDLDEALGAVHLRLLGSCDGCPSSAITLQNSVERAIVEAAPEIVIIDVEQPAVVAAAATTASEGAVPIALSRKPMYDACPSELAST